MPLPKTPERNPKLTHAEAIDVIRNGGAICHNGQIITTVAEMPDEAEFAGDDTSMLSDSLDDIAAQKAALEAREAAVKERLAKAGKVDADAGKPAEAAHASKVDPLPLPEPKPVKPADASKPVVK